MASVVTKGIKPILPQCFHGHKVGVVVSAGRMTGAVKVRVAEQEWNKKFRKHFPAPKNYLVRDPNSSLVPGDVVRITSGFRTSKQIHHVVTAIVAPFGEPVENRPPVLTVEQLEQARIHQRLLKDVRSAQKGRQASVHRIEVARRQGHEIPTLEEAMKGLTMYEEDLRSRGIGVGKEEVKGKEKNKGQVGQQATAKQRRVDEGKKTKDEVKAEEKVKSGRRRRASM